MYVTQGHSGSLRVTQGHSGSLRVTNHHPLLGEYTLLLLLIKIRNINGMGLIPWLSFLGSSRKQVIALGGLNSDHIKISEGCAELLKT